MTVGVLCLFLTIPLVRLWSVFMAFPGQTQSLIERNSSATFQTAIVSGNLDTCMTNYVTLPEEYGNRVSHQDVTLTMK